jgi:hypothetical protein
LAATQNATIPWLSSGCPAPVVAGAGRLVSAAMQGTTQAGLAALIDGPDSSDAGRLYDSAIARQIAFRRAEGLGLQDQALAASPLFRVRRGPAGANTLRVLALCGAGDLMANTPLEFITNHLDVQLDLLFVSPERALPAVIPDHDVAFFAASEISSPLTEILCRLHAAWPRPALNDPSLLPILRRDRLARALADIEAVVSPRLVTVARPVLLSVADGAASLGSVLPDCDYPLLLRPCGSHGGEGLCKIDSPAALAATLSSCCAPAYYLSAFVDYRSPDELFRKYRVAFVDRAPHLCHMAISEHWMVHYLNAGMAENPARREEEAGAMAAFDTGFARRHRTAFTSLHQRIGFDYYLIDCAETQDGRLLVFEADTAAIVHAMDPPALFAYKQAPMRRLFDAFDSMLRRAAHEESGKGAARPH